MLNGHGKAYANLWKLLPKVSGISKTTRLLAVFRRLWNAPLMPSTLRLCHLENTQVAISLSNFLKQDGETVFLTKKNVSQETSHMLMKSQV